MPVQSHVHIDAALTNFAVQLGNQDEGYAAPMVAPVIPVAKESDKYFVFNQEESDIAAFDLLRVPGDTAREFDWATTSATYGAEEYAIRMLLPDRIRNNADSPVRPQQATIRKLMALQKKSWEKRVYDQLSSTTYMTNNTTPSTKWDAAGADIMGDVFTAKRSMQILCGSMPTHILINPEVADVMARDSGILDLVKHTHSDLLVNGNLPRTIWNMTVVVPGATYNSANPAQTVSLDSIWASDNVTLLHIQPTPDLMTRTCMYTVRVPQAGRNAFLVKRYRDEPRGGEWFEVSVIQDELLVSAACGYLLNSCLT